MPQGSSAVRPTKGLYLFLTFTRKQNNSSDFFNNTTAPSGPGCPHYRDFMITLRHTTIGRTPLEGWSARRRDLHLTTQQHSQQTYIHATGGIRTHNPSKQATAAPRLRPRGHWDRRQATYINQKMFIGRDISGALWLHLFVDVKLWNTFQKFTTQWSSLRYRRRGNLQLVFLKPSHWIQDVQMFSTVSSPTWQTSCRSLNAIVAQPKLPIWN
jgi:hypothetical protein